MPSATTWMDLENIIPSEVSQTDKDRYFTVYLMWNLQNNANESIYKTETDMQTQKISLRLPKGKWKAGGINQEYEINMLKTT